MSLVGTRPPTVDEWDKYELHHRARLATKPGLGINISSLLWDSQWAKEAVRVYVVYHFVHVFLIS